MITNYSQMGEKQIQSSGITTNHFKSLLLMVKSPILVFFLSHYPLEIKHGMLEIPLLYFDEFFPHFSILNPLNPRSVARFAQPGRDTRASSSRLALAICDGVGAVPSLPREAMSYLIDRPMNQIVPSCPIEC